MKNETIQCSNCGTSICADDGELCDKCHEPVTLAREIKRLGEINDELVATLKAAKEMIELLLAGRFDQTKYKAPAALMRINAAIRKGTAGV